MSCIVVDTTLLHTRQSGEAVRRACPVVPHVVLLLLVMLLPHQMLLLLLLLLLLTDKFKLLTVMREAEATKVMMLMVLGRFRR